MSIQPPIFDWRLSIGNILTMLIVLGGLASMWVDRDMRLKEVENRMVIIERSVESVLLRETASTAQYISTREEITEIKTDIRHMKGSLERIEQRMSRSP